MPVLSHITNKNLIILFKALLQYHYNNTIMYDDESEKDLELTQDDKTQDDKTQEDKTQEDKTRESDQDSDEIIQKKRGPKKRIIKKNMSINFTLYDSDEELSSKSDGDDQVKKLIPRNIPKQIKIESHVKSTLSTPWIEKYRPNKIEDLVLDANTHNNIKKIINDKIMPNIIITGVPGIGKTTTILCIAKNLHGINFRESVLELNASDERGVKTVQKTIESFCKKKMSNDGDYSKHKLVLLDEADNMTKKAQQTISVLIDTYRNTTRFAFTCNNSSEIISAIQSRCIIFRYNRLDNTQITNRLKTICDIEKVPYTLEGLNAIVITAQGDLRQAINNLQLTYNGYNYVIPDNVYRLCDKPHPLIIQNIFIACSKKDIKSALTILNDLSNKGYSSSDISLSMLHTLKNIDQSIINEQTKIKYMEEISKECLIINKGMNTPLQLNGTIASLCK